MYCVYSTHSEWSVYCFFVNPISLTTSTISATFLFSIDTEKTSSTLLTPLLFTIIVLIWTLIEANTVLFANVFIFAIFLLIVFHYLGKKSVFSALFGLHKRMQRENKKSRDWITFVFIQVWECGNTKKSEKPGLPRMFQCMAIYWLICYRQNVITDIQT